MNVAHAENAIDSTLRERLVDRDRVVRWNVVALVELVPGTTRRIWLAELIPQLVSAGVMRKLGRCWMAKRGEIEQALLGRLETRKRGR